MDYTITTRHRQPEQNKKEHKQEHTKMFRRLFNNLVRISNSDDDFDISTPRDVSNQQIDEDKTKVNNNNNDEIYILPLFDMEQVAMIPIEIWRCIISFLPINNYLTLMMVNRGWNNVIDDEYMWAHVFNIYNCQVVEDTNHEDHQYWKQQVKAHFGWSKFSSVHIAAGLALKDNDRTVYSVSNRSFSPVIIKNALPPHCTIEIEFCFTNLSVVGYTGVGVATEDLIFQSENSKNQSGLVDLSTGYIGQYHSERRNATNIGYFENGYMSCNFKNIGNSQFFSKYSSDDIVKMVINPDKNCFDVEDGYYGSLKYYVNDKQIGGEYKAFKLKDQRLYVVVNVEGSGKVSVTIKSVKLHN